MTGLESHDIWNVGFGGSRGGFHFFISVYCCAFSFFVFGLLVCSSFDTSKVSFPFFPVNSDHGLLSVIEIPMGWIHGFLMLGLELPLIRHLVPPFPIVSSHPKPHIFPHLLLSL